jgi:hypothetical protein
MFELNVPDAGLYPFVTHAFAYTGRGAVGIIKIDPNAPEPRPHIQRSVTRSRRA